MLAASGCAPAPPPGDEVTLSTGRLSAHLSRLSPPLDSLEEVRQLAYVADQLRLSRLQPAFHGGYQVPDIQGGTAAFALGYVAGRNPNVSSEIVLVTADLDGPAVASVLESARLLAAEAQSAIVPERTVGVAVWGSTGVEAFVARPPWVLEGIERVLMVTDDTLRALPRRRLWEEVGLPVSWVTPVVAAPVRGGQRSGAERLALTYRLAIETHLAVRAASGTPLSAPIAPDSALFDRRIP